MLSDFAALAVLATIIGAFVYTQVPAHWQSPLGFLLIVFGWLPLGVLVACVVKAPVVMIPALIVFIAVTATQRA